ncbi:ArnT family glycosyltransferase [Sandaracinus amylolyticus]|uniref:Uncharacterized protein n=1 Tax=Sandaracinus amylolyticus TaxID=927083 RepID=A0A0F6W0Z7_9BACT|nr:glycosyltransferase family 39 protein [Sandaracinus amylolyticus]AKF04483.1 hypothetical protein DB32_001632 [Sandaracinus amylolyticus]
MADRSPPRASKRALATVVALGALLSIPNLFVGPLHDDLVHQLVLEGMFDLPDDPLGLYEFTHGEASNREMIARGWLHWWTDPQLTLRFFRPLSSALLAIDHALFGRAAFPSHLHSLLWGVLLFATAAALMRRCLDARTAVIASLVYAVAGAHVMTLAWPASRHTMVSAALGGLALVLHLRWREDRRPVAAIGAPFALALSLLASETGLAAAIYVLTYEAMVATGSPRDRARAALPTLVVCGAYVAFYVLAGYGAHHSGTYTSPFREPLSFALVASARVPALLAEAIGAVSTFAYSTDPTSRVILVTWGLVSIAGSFGLLAVVRRSGDADGYRRLRWLFVACVTSLVPMVAGLIGPRMLPMGLFGASAMVGSAITVAWRASRERRGAARHALAGLAIAIAIAHVGLGSLVRLTVPFAFAAVAEAERRLATEGESGGCTSSGLVYLINGADAVLSVYAAPSIAYYSPQAVGPDARFRVLASAPHDLQVERTGERTMTVASAVRPRGENIFEQVFRSHEHPLREGDTVVAEEMTIRVLEMDPEGPASFEVELDRSLDDERVCLIVWRDGALRRIAPPGVGESLTVAHEPGPMGM